MKTFVIAIISLVVSWVLILPVALIASATAGTPFSFLNTMINERGPITYLLLILSFHATLVFLITAVTRSFYPGFKRRYLILVFLPLVAGLAGTVMGFSSVVAGYSEFLVGVTDLEMLKDAQQSVLIGLGVAFDPLLLGLMSVIVNLLLLSFKE